ncbi:YkgJ family cysteine cluster protein [Phenylobacterium sp.]|uniref:YkgJ family cysteine cluster protein n=1 Tax=Phenylobacterium sp. TaxID=1871053 RepID=UPI0030F44E2B
MTTQDKYPPMAPVRLSAGDPDQGPLATGAATLVLGGEPVAFELTVPAGPVAVEDVLPIFQGLSSLLAARAAAKATAAGRSVSCQAGCGACCRQLVPIAPAEARALARVVDAMPEPRQSEVRARFDAAVATVSATDLFEGMTEPDVRRINAGRDYFKLGVPCPFLVDEACSIHPDRPLSCREYLVISSPDHCRALSAEGIEKLVLEGDPSLAVLKSDLRDGWLPLIHALVFDQSAPPSPRDRTGPEILADVLGRL